MHIAHPGEGTLTTDRAGRLLAGRPARSLASQRRPLHGVPQLIRTHNVIHFIFEIYKEM
jgi:hypothetical protein